MPGRVASVVICGFVSDGGIMVYDGERCITVARAVYCDAFFTTDVHWQYQQVK